MKHFRRVYSVQTICDYLNLRRSEIAELELLTDERTEVDRALDNLAKSGKLYSMPSRRDSVPMMGGQPSFADFGMFVKP